MEQEQDKQQPLLPLVARGEASAVEQCVARYSALVWSLARRLSAEQSALEELVQEVFIDLWKSADRFDDRIAEETTFVAMIARRRIIDAKRRAQRQPATEVLAEETIASGESDYARVEAVDTARKALATLRPEQRELILLSVVEGWTHQELVRKTGLPLGTIKSHIRRGLERTASILRAMPDGGAA